MFQFGVQLDIKNKYKITKTNLEGFSLEIVKKSKNQENKKK